MPRLIRVFAGRTLILLVLSCCGSYVWSTYSKLLWTCATSEDWDQPGRPLKGYLRTQGFFMRTAKTDQSGQIWDLSLLGAQVLLLVLPCCGSGLMCADLKISLGKAKPTKSKVRTAKTQSNQHAHPHSLIYCLHCLHKKTFSFWVPIERQAKTDQTAWMPRLIWVCSWGTCHFLVFSCHGFICCNFPKFSDRQVGANSADPDQTAPWSSLVRVYTICNSLCIFGCITLRKCHLVQLL